MSKLKKMLKVKYFFLSLVVLLTIGGGSALALTAADFYNEAAAYSFQKCQTITTNNPEDRLENTICFLLSNQADNQIKWALQKNTNTAQANNNASQQTAIDNLQSVTLNKSNVYRRDSSPATVTTTTPATAEAFCDDANDIVLSGGFVSSPDKKMHITSNIAGDESSGVSSWAVTGFGESPSGFEFLAYANCYSIN